MTTSKPISGPESSLSDVLSELDMRGLSLLQPCSAIRLNGKIWVIVTIQEHKTTRTFTGEGSDIWSALNTAVNNAETAGLRSSRLS